MDPPWQCAYTEQINLPQLLYLWLPLICICAVVVVARQPLAVEVGAYM